MQGKSLQYEDTKLEDQIQRVFNCVVLGEKLSQKALQKAKQLMLIDLKSTVSQALDKSIRRDGTSSQLQAKDLLSVVQSKGQIYKYKVVRAFIINKSQSQLKDKHDKVDKTSKQQQIQFQADD